MSKQYDLKSATDIFDYNSGWFSDSSIGSLFYQLFGTIPSMKKLKYKMNREVLDEIKELYQKEEEFDTFDYTYYNPSDEDDDEEDDTEDKPSDKEQYECYIICKRQLLIGYFNEHIIIAYSSDIEVSEIAKLQQLGDKYRQAKENLNNLFIVTYEHNYFSLKQSKINQPEVKIDQHYNDDFAPVATEIENFLTSENNSGLVILHGKQGTGKTTYIRHLINQGKKKMLYMGGDLIEKLSDPTFITFIRRQKDAIFIVEDCEELLASRTGSTRMNSGLINILNISDGLLSDELGIKFICTFNAPLKDIDQALLRKGRLAARYEFKDLEVDKINRIIKEENLDIPLQDKPMTLAELYNYEGRDFSLGKKRVGF